MAIAKQQIGVTRGYKPKTKRVEKRERSVFHNMLATLRASAREFRAFIADEIVYATMDTARVLNYLQYELGFRTRTRVEPVMHELEQFVHEHELIHESGTLATEKIRM